MKYTILLFLSLIVSLTVKAEVITAINIIGNVNVKSQTIKSQLSFDVGDDITDAKLNYAAKKLYATELFSNISINIKSSELVINIKENPIVNKLLIENNKSVKTKDIENVIKLQSNTIFTKEKLQNDILEIVKLYRVNGIINVVIKPYKILLEDNKMNIVYKIEEGKKAKIRRINFVHNRHFFDNLLKSILLSREYRFYNFFTNDHYYISDRLSLDGSILRNFYFSQGFLEFKIDSIIPEFDGEEVDLTFILEEGKKYIVNDIHLTSSLEGLRLDDIGSIVKIKKGDVFNINKVNSSIEKITTFLHDKGYYFAVVTPDYETVDNTVTINYKITEGKQIYINRIDIEGNTRTLDHVIRRELKISENEPYNSTLINQSKRNIIDLGIFENANISTSKKDFDKIDLKITVKERATGFANIGGGLSSHVGFIGNISAHEKNLLGSGNSLSFSLEKGSSTFNSSISFTKPYIFDSPISSGFDLFKETTEHKHSRSYNSSSYGITLRASYNINEDLKHLLRYSYKKNNIYDVDDNSSPVIKDQIGITYTSLIGYSLNYNKLDNPIKPKHGYLIKCGQDLAGIGGDLYYLRSEFSATHFMTVKNYENLILQALLKASYIGAYNNQKVRIGQRFFMGDNEIRGFKPLGIGPRDSKTNDALGGKSRIFGTLQADFPIGLPSDLEIKGSLFFDAGTLTGLDLITNDVVDSGNLRASVGFGFSWFSPVGLLRLDFGFPVMKDKYDVTEMMRFNMGRRF